jgi:hypothetical protein
VGVRGRVALGENEPLAGVGGGLERAEQQGQRTAIGRARIATGRAAAKSGALPVASTSLPASLK